MSASNDFDEALIARWETTAHGIYTGENASEFARLIALARRATAAEARVEELEAETAKCGDCCGVSDDEYTSVAKLCIAQGKRIRELEAALSLLIDFPSNVDTIARARKLLENKP